MQKDKHRKRLS